MRASRPPPTGRWPAAAGAVLAPAGSAPPPVAPLSSPARCLRPLLERNPPPVAPLREPLQQRFRLVQHQRRAGRRRLVIPWGSPPPPVSAQPRARARWYPSHPQWSAGRLPNLPALRQPSGARDGGLTAVRLLPFPMPSEVLPDTPPPGHRSRVRALPGSATTPSASAAPRRRVRRGSGLARPRVQPGRVTRHPGRAGVTARVRAVPARPAAVERGRILA